MSEGLFSKFSDLLCQFKLELTNASFAAEPEVLGHEPESGQPVPLRHPVRTTIHPQRLQATAEGPMPSGLGYDHLSHVSTGLDRSCVDAGFVQSQDYRDDDPEAAQPPQPAGGPRVTFAASGSESVFVREPEDEEEDDRDSIGEALAVIKLSIAQSIMYMISMIPLVLFLILRLHHGVILKLTSRCHNLNLHYV